MKIFDCFTFNDENLILEIRLNELDKYVDYFIIIEFGENHQGKKKGRKIDQVLLNKFKHKIRYFYTGEFNKNFNSWERENYQRNAIREGLYDADKNDLIIISDADEIPNLKILEQTKIKKFAIFKQRSFVYKLNLLYEEDWLGSSICYKKYLKSPQWLRNKRFLRRGFLRKFFFKTQIINKGGWHFSFLKDAENIVKKINAYAHSEYKNHTNIDEIKKHIYEKTYFIHPDRKLKKILIDETYPNYLRENKRLYSNWIS